MGYYPEEQMRRRDYRYITKDGRELTGKPAFTKRRHRFKAPIGATLCIWCGHPVTNTSLHYEPVPEGWEPMELAPMNARDVEVLLPDGESVIAHYAQDLSGEDCPPFKGWFVDAGSYNRQIETPIGWKAIKK